MDTAPRHSARSAPTREMVEQELLQQFLSVDADDTVYPWNPADVETDAFFADLEQAMADTGWSAEQIPADWQTIATQLDSLWAEVDTAQDTSVGAVVDASATVAQPLAAALMEQFAEQVPAEWLHTIAQQVQALVNSNLAIADQLVQSVKTLLPGWGEDDLYVLARPFAYAMRGSDSEMMEAALRSVRYAAWTELSGVEQARLSLAIARYALAQANQPGERS